MLYRRFPESSNSEISILCSDITDPQVCTLLPGLTSQGINLFRLTKGTASNTDSSQKRQSCLSELKQAFSTIPEGSSGKNLLWDISTPLRTVEEIEQAAVDARSDLKSLGWQGAVFFLFHIDDAETLKLTRSPQIQGLTRMSGFEHIAAGFCTHGAAADELFRSMLERTGMWSFFGWTGNYANTGDTNLIIEAGRAGLGGIGIDPFSGGILEYPLPAARSVFSASPIPRIASEWALRYLWEFQDIISVCVQPLHELKLAEYAAFAAGGRPNSLTRSELALLEKAGSHYLT